MHNLFCVIMLCSSESLDSKVSGHIFKAWKTTMDLSNLQLWLKKVPTYKQFWLDGLFSSSSIAVQACSIKKPVAKFEQKLFLLCYKQCFLHHHWSYRKWMGLVLNYDALVRWNNGFHQFCLTSFHMNVCSIISIESTCRRGIQLNQGW